MAITFQTCKSESKSSRDKCKSEEISGSHVPGAGTLDSRNWKYGAHREAKEHLGSTCCPPPWGSFSLSLSPSWESAKESHWSRLILRIVQFHLTVHPKFFSLSLSILHLLGQWTKGMSSLCVYMYTAELQSDPRNLSSSGGSTCYPWTFRLAARHVVRPALPFRRLSTTSLRRTLSRSRHSLIYNSTAPKQSHTRSALTHLYLSAAT